jgi:hypothetical protein
VQVKVQRKARSQRTAHCHGQEAEHEVVGGALLLAGGVLLAEQEVVGGVLLAEQEVVGGALLLAGGALLLAGGAPGDSSGLCVDPAHLCSQ